MIVIYDCNDSGQYYKITMTAKASLTFDRKLQLIISVIYNRKLRL
jgi:hypothetical protein